MDQTFMALVELQNGFKVEGKITSIDKVNMKITIVNATRYNEDNMKKEFFPELIIEKTEIKEVKKINYDIVSKTTQMGNQNIYLLPSPANRKKPQLTLSNDGFFDNLNHLSPNAERNEIYRYNEKNKETFYGNNQNFTPQNNKREILNFQQRKMFLNTNTYKRNYRNKHVYRTVPNNYRSRTFHNSRRNYIKPYNSTRRSYNPRYQQRYYTRSTVYQKNNSYNHNYNEQLSRNYNSNSYYPNYKSYYNNYHTSYKSNYNSYQNSYRTADYNNYQNTQNPYYSYNNNYYNKARNNDFYYKQPATSYSYRGYNNRSYY